MNEQIYMNPQAIDKQELEMYCASLRIDLCNWIRDDY